MTRSLRAALNESNPNKISDGFRVALAGDALALTPAFIASAVTANTIVLANKAAFILAAFAVAGGATGALTVVAGVPAAGQVAVSPAGDIVFAAADGVTSAEVTYAAQDGETFTETVDIVGSAALFLQSKRGVRLVSATVLTSNIPAGLGAKTIAARGSAPAAGAAALSTAGTGVAFNAGNVVTGTASVTYIATPGVGAAPLGLAGRLASQVAF